MPPRGTYPLFCAALVAVCCDVSRGERKLCELSFHEVVHDCCRIIDVFYTERVPKLVGQDRLEVVFHAGIRRRDGVLRGVDLGIAVEDLARLDVERDGRETQGIFSSLVRPSVVAKHNDVGVGRALSVANRTRRRREPRPREVGRAIGTSKRAPGTE